MHLVKKQIPRSYLPGPSASEQLQLLIAAAELDRITDVLFDLTAPKARFVSRMIEALGIYDPPPTEDENFVGRFTSDDVQVSSFYEDHAYLGDDLSDDSPNALGVHILVSLWCYEQGNTGDPDEIFHVVMYWDVESGLWRMYDELWAVDITSDPVVDGQAPATVQAIVVELDDNDGPTVSRFDTPSLLETLLTLRSEA